MTTEYRQNIPSVAHVEAATRLGLEWRRESHSHNIFLTRFRYVDGQPHSNWATYPELANYLAPVSLSERTYSYRPVRPDGTPVDWEVLDQEVARVEQQEQTASPLAQPQGFRSDLWRRICQHFISADEDRVSSRHLSDVETIERRGCLFRDGDGWQWLEDEGPTRTDILARWIVYQELKPLYDIVDGAQGEAAMPAVMPRDVEAEWDRQSLGSAYNLETYLDGDWVFGRDSLGVFARSAESDIWRAGPSGSQAPLRNFAAVLDAVAERRVAERQATAAEPTPSVSPLREQMAPTVTSAPPEPRRFADVRPDRHGWRWWRVQGPGIANTAQIECSNHLGEVERQFRFRGSGFEPWTTFILDRWLDRTVIPTDEQGNPVSWLSCGLLSHISVGSVGPMLPMQASFEGPTGEIEFSDAYTPPPGASGWVTLSGLHDSMRALPRFGLIELDDDDRTGQSQQAPGPALRSGTIPTAAQVAKFRGVLSRKLDNTLADAVKESKISCEVSQYIMQRWAGGLGDEEAAELINLIVRFGTSTKSAAEVDRHAEAILASWSPRFADLGNEPPRPTPSRGELEERRRRLAELQARLRAEREAQTAEELQEEPSRMALIEPDPAADPGASIRAWEERRKAAKAAAKLRPGLVTEREREPPRGPTVELVDATRLGFWLGRLYALASTNLPDTRLGARLGPRQRASG